MPGRRNRSALGSVPPDMKRRMPLITLLAGTVVGVVILVASMLSTTRTAPHNDAAAVSTPGSAVVTRPAPVSPAAKASTFANVPARADYAGRADGGDPFVAISIHGGQAIAYVCNGGVIEAWLQGTAIAGKLVMTGKNNARLKAAYTFSDAIGYLVVDGTRYTFSIPSVHKPSGLYAAIAFVRRAKIKAGWIVLKNGTQVGAVESNADSVAPSATRAPVLNLATGTAQDGGITLVATPISGTSGSGFGGRP